MKEMLKISGISYEINSVPLFEQISASVQQGDIIGVIGKNGAGKSLL
ncbi:ATP-binding cassette domain-containing protein, partial [Bacillus velezensis]